MFDQYIAKINELRKRNEIFVLATVIGREIPSSGKIGDKAVITVSGEITGWIGGGCVKGIILRESLEAMNTGKGRLVKIGQNPFQFTSENIKEYKMTCHSEGSIDVFIEPIIPLKHIVVVGKTEIAKAIVRISKAAGYRVTVVATDAKPSMFEKPDELITRMYLKDSSIHALSNIVVCTQGEDDEEALTQALSIDHYYLGFVASRKKREAVWSYLKSIGITDNQLDSIQSPAGIDIQAKRPEEVAISILAGIVEFQNNGRHPINFSGPVKEDPSKVEYYINPVCGIPVSKTNPKHIIEYKNEKIYFCCDGCKISFEKDPQKYMDHPAPAGKGM
mgnify:CR=1 FL=1